MKTNIGISDNMRQSVEIELSKFLADEFVLATKTRSAHWNVEGIDFYDKHIFFETQLHQLDEIIDGVAERIRSLGHYAPATLKEFLELTHLLEVKRSKTNYSKAYITELLADHESIIIHCRENIHYFGTSDFIANLMLTHEKMAYLLRSHLN
jgi:starvation-inducible DNA-binding protein